MHRVNKSDDGCWEWSGSVGAHGYGAINVNKVVTTTHRLAYSLLIGPVPDDMFVCHSCDNRRCVRPNHLFLGSPAENASDMAVKGRAPWKGKTRSPEAKQKMREAKLGKTGRHTEAQRLAASKTMQTLWADPEFRQRQIEISTGRIKSAEEIEKMRQAALRQWDAKREGKAHPPPENIDT
jgi:hypothetical protein